MLTYSSYYSSYYFTLLSLLSLLSLFTIDLYLNYLITRIITRTISI